MRPCHEGVTQDCKETSWNFEVRSPKATRTPSNQKTGITIDEWQSGYWESGDIQPSHIQEYLGSQSKCCIEITKTGYTICLHQELRQILVQSPEYVGLFAYVRAASLVKDCSATLLQPTHPTAQWDIFPSGFPTTLSPRSFNKAKLSSLSFYSKPTTQFDSISPRFRLIIAVQSLQHPFQQIGSSSNTIIKDTGLGLLFFEYYLPLLIWYHRPIL